MSTAQLVFFRDITGATIMLTAVTFLNPGTETTINFCGDQRGKFQVDHDVQVDFNTAVVVVT